MSEPGGMPAREGELPRGRLERVLSFLSLAGIILLSLVVLVMTVAAFGGLRFGRVVASEVGILLDGAPVLTRATLHATIGEDLPSPVRKYLGFAFSGSPFRMSRVFMKHDGQLRISEDARWLYTYGEQYYRADVPGFVWHARAFIIPRLFWIEARDMLIGDRAGMLVKLGSVVTVADEKGSGIFQADLLRWLAEAPLFPYAFVSGRIKWKESGPRSAVAILEWKGQTVSGRFRFDSLGRITGFETEGRYRKVGKDLVKTPWSGRFADYRRFSGVMVPTRLEAAWNLPSGDLVYGRFQVLSLYYDKFLQ